MREVLADVSVHPKFARRVADCGRPRSATVDVVVGDGVAHIARIATCGSLLDPVCGAKIRSWWADRNNEGIDRHITAGNSAWLVTPTIPHHAGMTCKEGADLVMAAWSKLIATHRWRRLKQAIGYVGFMRGFDITYGEWHGWHPHMHVVVLTSGEASAEVLAALKITLSKLWADQVQCLGYDRPDPIHGVDVRQVSAGEGVGAYLAKGWQAGDEISRGDLKTARDGSRVPDEILADFMITGNAADRDLRREYEDAMFGRRQFAWSHRLFEILDLGHVRTNEEIAAAEVDGTKVAVMDAVLHTHLKWRCLLAPALSAVERGGYTELAAFVVKAGGDPEHLREVLDRTIPPEDDSIGPGWRCEYPRCRSDGRIHPHGVWCDKHAAKMERSAPMIAPGAFPQVGGSGRYGAHGETTPQPFSNLSP